MAEGRVIDPDRVGEVSRGHNRRRQRAGIEIRMVSHRRRPERKERRSRFVPRRGTASVRQRELPLGNHGDESTSGTGRDDAPVGRDSLLERVLEADNLRRALRPVRRSRAWQGDWKHLIHRTAVYVTRMYGGVGGGEPRGSSLSRFGLTNRNSAVQLYS